MTGTLWKCQHVSPKAVLETSPSYLETSSDRPAIAGGMYTPKKT